MRQIHGVLAERARPALATHPLQVLTIYFVQGTTCLATSTPWLIGHVAASLNTPTPLKNSFSKYNGGYSLKRLVVRDLRPIVITLVLDGECLPRGTTFPYKRRVRNCPSCVAPRLISLHSADMIGSAPSGIFEIMNGFVRLFGFLFLVR